jgi:hypothetical protein
MLGRQPLFAAKRQLAAAIQSKGRAPSESPANTHCSAPRGRAQSQIVRWTPRILRPLEGEGPRRSSYRTS